jgi:hypothetical protein
MMKLIDGPPSHFEHNLCILVNSGEEFTHTQQPIAWPDSFAAGFHGMAESRGKDSLLYFERLGSAV